MLNFLIDTEKLYEIARQVAKDSLLISFDLNIKQLLIQSTFSDLGYGNHFRAIYSIGNSITDEGGFTRSEHGIFSIITDCEYVLITYDWLGNVLL